MFSGSTNAHIPQGSVAIILPPTPPLQRGSVQQEIHCPRHRDSEAAGSRRSTTCCPNVVWRCTCKSSIAHCPQAAQQ